MPKANTTADRVRALIQPIAEELGLMLWDVRFVKKPCHDAAGACVGLQ